MTDWDINTALNHHAACYVYDDGHCTCGLRARRDSVERSPLAPGEGTWSVFAEKAVLERDDAKEEAWRLRLENDDLKQEIGRLRGALEDIKRWADPSFSYSNPIDTRFLAQFCEKVLRGEKE